MTLVMWVACLLGETRQAGRQADMTSPLRRYLLKLIQREEHPRKLFYAVNVYKKGKESFHNEVWRRRFACGGDVGAQNAVPVASGLPRNEYKKEWEEKPLYIRETVKELHVVMLVKS
jgi:hypothetical protein